MDEVSRKSVNQNVHAASTAEKISDMNFMLNYLNDLRSRNNLPPFSQEQMERFRANREQRRAEHEQAVEIQKKFNAIEARKDNWPGSFLMGNLQRAVGPFLRPLEPQAGELEYSKEFIEESNKEFLDSLNTNEGIRNFFYQILDQIEEKGEEIFWVQDKDYLMNAVEASPEYIKLGFILGAVHEYAEASGLDPRLTQSLKERLTVFENAGFMQSYATRAAEPLYELLDNMTVEEAIETVSTLHADNREPPVDNSLFPPIINFLNNKLAEGLNAPQEEIAQTAHDLAWRGFMKGDFSFRDTEGKRLTHENGLAAISRGETVVLEHYNSRKDEEGVTCHVTKQDGMIVYSNEKRCTRAPIPDQEYDPNYEKIGRKLKEQLGADFRSISGKNTRELTWEETIRILGTGRSVQLTREDGSREQISAQMDAQSGTYTISTKKAGAERESLLSSPEKAMEFLNTLMSEKGSEIFSPERRQEIMDSVKQQEQMTQAFMEVKRQEDEMLLTLNQYRLPDEAGNLKRLAAAYLQKPDTLWADEQNRHFIDSLKTPEGRHKLFYRALDDLEKEGPGALLDSSPENVAKTMLENPKLAQIAFAFKSALGSYINDPEAIEMDERLAQSLEEQTLLWENGGDFTNCLRTHSEVCGSFFAAMTDQELNAVMSLASAARSEEEIDSMGEVSRLISAEFATRASAAESYCKTGQKLAERGMLKGNLVFRDSEGKRMKHVDAIKALHGGKEVTLEQYESRKSGEGTRHHCKMEDGELQTESEPCSREPIPDTEYDPRKHATASAILELTKRHTSFLDSEGKTVPTRDAVARLAAGETLTAAQYDAQAGYLGKQKQVRVAPDAQNPGVMRLETGNEKNCTRVLNLAEDVQTPEKQRIELEKLQAVLKKSDPFYVWNSSEFNQLMDALDKTIRFHKNPAQAAQKPEGTLQQLYDDLNAKVDAYLQMKTDKMQKRTDADERGHLRFDVVSSLKSLTNEAHTRKITQSFERGLERQQAAPQQAAPQQKKKQSGPKL